jgi:predicted anti-sigma-YlaC factor YlaD
MKNCREIQAELSAYIDNEIPTATRVALEKHVQDCALCRARLAELNALTAGVMALPRLRPPPGFLAEVRRRIMRDGKDQPSWQDYIFRPLWLKVPLEAAAVIATVLLVMQAERSVNERKPRREALQPAEEPASTTVVLGAKPQSIAKLAPNRLVGSAAPGPADAAAGNIMIVRVKDFEVARNRIQQLASTMNGRIVAPPFEKTAAHTLFVQLPPENVKAFKSQLQNAPASSTALQPSPANESISLAEGAAHAEKTSGRVVLQIQVLAPDD